MSETDSAPRRHRTTAGFRPHAQARLPRGGLVGGGVRWLALGLAILLAAPIAAVALGGIGDSGGTWSHLAQTTLAGLVTNSILLTLGVVTISTAAGAGAAWLVTRCDFPLRRLFEVALILPMTVPGYIVAIVYYELLTYAGPVQSWLRGVTGWGRGDYWFPDIASLPGAIVLLSAISYPYIYLTARAAFLTQSERLAEAGRALGLTGPRLFFRLALPVARPAIAAGAGFAAMETLADFGAVSHLGVPTLTTGIYRTWFSAGSPVAAARLAALLLAIVALLLVIERQGRGAARAAGEGGGREVPPRRVRLRGARAVAAMIGCAAPVVAGFAVPLGVLIHHHLNGGDPMLGRGFLRLALHSAALSAGAAVLIVGLALFIAMVRRFDAGRASRVAQRLAGFGYAVPGSVVAIGLLVGFGWAARGLDPLTVPLLGFGIGPLLTGTIAGLLFAYSVRFTAVALGSLEAGLGRIPPSLDDAARGLGHGRLARLRRVHLPLLRPSIITAAVFVFADTMKELPATLIVRPFDFDTLAVRVHRLAADSRVTESSSAALLIVLIGLAPLGLLVRAMGSTSPDREKSDKNT